jgi:Flp pilus assembly protein TadB
MVLGALLFSGAVFCLLVAVAPRPARLQSAPRGGLEFIRNSTLDQPPASAADIAWLHAVLRRATARLRVRARGIGVQDLVEAGIDPELFTPAEFTTLKLLLGAGAASTCLVLGTMVSGLLVLAPAAAWLAFVAPSLYISRRRRRRRSEVLAELPDIVGLLRAFTNAQVPLEQALHLVSRQLAEADPGNLLAAQLRLALGDYGLGETIETSLARMADRLGVEEVRTLVTGIAQGKRLGAGTEMILRDQELLVRMAQRNRATASASQISTRLMGVLVGVYLPEFVILVMVPLFWGVMLRAFG